MQNSSRILALLAYVLIFFIALLGPLVWAIVGWILLWVPSVGAVIAFSLFSLVISLLIAVLYAWVIGLVNAVRAERQAVPFFGGWTRHLPL